ncbi:hypothetical protein BJ508DRAFT_114750 [Ascobolus immersus RN42]|uniref:Pentacotripeptide-repeat region of PRORP domain-containing protein n=1 Tax=Ascobolus immersus RN42 TaxID=1160509 RepID=A0A3N4IBA9_ASCIM|nr:hypothetical protein BJ508DRAFT_114750 [Ascobolus immersus RN42]
MNPASRLFTRSGRTIARSVFANPTTTSTPSTCTAVSPCSSEVGGKRNYGGPGSGRKPGQKKENKQRRDRPEKVKDKEKEKTRKGTTVAESIVPKLALHELRSVYSQEIFVFRCDLETLQIAGAMKTYETLRSVDILTHDDISNLCRQLHTHYRLHRDRAQTFKHILQLLNDLEKHIIPGHPLASVHLLTCLKEMGEFDVAHKFWTWLEMQEEEFTDARVYGAAIELFAAMEKPLEETEALYTAALMRYSEGLSASTAKASNLTTRSMLLQGICTARILAGNWEAAYEALDTCLRLYPDRVPSRIYELFIYHRPLPEAVLTFYTACRNGSPPLPKVFQALLSAVNRDSGDLITLFRLVTVYAAAGGKLRHESLTTLLQGLLASYPTLKSADPTVKLDDVLELVNTLFAEFSAAGVSPHTHHFNAIISQAGRLNHEPLILMALKDFLTTGLAPTPTTFRSMLAAFEKVGNASQVRETWKTYCSSRAEGFLASDATKTSASLASPDAVQREAPWTIVDLKTLIRACVLTKNGDFATTELDRLRPELEPHVFDEAHTYLTWALQIGPEELTKMIAKSEAKHGRTAPRCAPDVTLPALQASVRTLTEVLRAPTLGDFSRDERLAFIDGEGAPVPDVAAREGTPMWTVYEKLCGAFKKDLKGEEAKRRIATGVTLRQARFLNWRSVNRLLAMAVEGQKRRADEGWVVLRDRAHWTIGLKGVKK